MSDLADLPLPVAIHQQVRFGVEQNRTSNLLRPIVEVRDPTQRSLDAANNDGHILEGLSRPLRVYDHGAIGSLATCTIRRVSVVATNATVRRVAVHHRIHVSGGD